MPKILNDSTEESIEKKVKNSNEYIDKLCSSIRKEREKSSNYFSELKSRAKKSIKVKDVRKLFFLILDPSPLNKMTEIINTSLDVQKKQKEEKRIKNGEEEDGYDSLDELIENEKKNGISTGQAWLEDFINNAFQMCVLASESLSKLKQLEKMQISYEKKFERAQQNVKKTSEACLLKLQEQKNIAYSPRPKKNGGDYLVNEIPFKSSDNM